MAHPIHRVTSFRAVGPFTLTVSFTDGTEQRIDFRPVLRGALFGPLQAPAFFTQVALASEAVPLGWPNGAVSAPATLHDWPQVSEELARRARTWPDPSSRRAS